MRTPANIAKHPIHPMLVAIPIGLWIFSLICDLVYRFGSTNPNWQVVAWYTLVGGILGALIAAVPGFIDMLSLPWATKRVALIHMSINLTVVALYVVNAYIRKHSGGVSDAIPPCPTRTTASNECTIRTYTTRNGFASRRAVRLHRRP